MMIGESMTMKERPFATLDHLLIGTPNLEETVRQYREIFGVEASFGGSHPAHGTSNYLLRIGERCYLELLGPTGGGAELDEIGRQMCDLPGDRLVGMALETPDMEETRSRAAAMGLFVRTPDAGERTTADGTKLRWRTARYDPAAFEDLLVFTIEWGKTPHPSEAMSQTGHLMSLEVRSPSDQAPCFFDDLGRSTIPVSKSPNLLLSASLQLPRARIDYFSDAEPRVTLMAEKQALGHDG